MFIPLVLCDQLECVVENLWLNYLFSSSYSLLYIAFLYCMWLPIWRIKLYILYACRLPRGDEGRKQRRRWGVGSDQQTNETRRRSSISVLIAFARVEPTEWSTVAANNPQRTKTIRTFIRSRGDLPAKSTGALRWRIQEKAELGATHGRTQRDEGINGGINV